MLFRSQRSHPLCVEAIASTDLILAVGLRAGAAEMSELKERAPEKNMILIGFDDARSAHYQGDDEQVADPKLFLEALLTRIGDYQRAKDEAKLAKMAAGKAALRDKLAANIAPHMSDNPIYPGVLMDAMNRVLDDRAVVASDVGLCQMWARVFRRIATPESFMQSGVWNAMSFGLPTAIVAKMEFPQRDVIGLAGDGASLMTIGDLPTAAEYGANIVLVVLNDGSFGQTYMQQTGLYGHTYGTAFKSPNFAQIGEACGCKGIRVTDPKNVEDAFKQALTATKGPNAQPAVLEVMIARHVQPRI